MGRLKVIAEELTAAAEKMSVPRPYGPDRNHPYGLAPPSAALPETQEAINQLANSTGILITALAAGDAQTQRLIFALKSAAAAYTKMDERSSATLGTQVNGSGEAPAIESVTPDAIPDVHVPEIDYGGYPSSPDDQWAKWTTAARAINEHGDPEAMRQVETFRTSWEQYKTELHNWVQGHIPAEIGNWQGDAAIACQNALKELRSWWMDMGEECTNLSKEADKVLTAHKQLASVHPNMYDVENTDAVRNPFDWANFQIQSEVDRNNYENAINLTQIRPGKPPGIIGVPAVQSDDAATPNGTQPPGVPGDSGMTGGEPGTGGATPEMPEMPGVPEMPSMSPAGLDPSAGAPSGSPSGGSPSGGSPSGGSPGGGAPSGGSPSGTPTGMPEGPATDVPALDEPTLAPASAGGGGGPGGGGGDIPKTPLAPAVGAENVAPSKGGPGIPAGAPGGPGAAGGMGGGMGGMGGGHGQGGQRGDKRRDPKLAPDEELYKEDRAWTEAVIGNRRRTDVKDTNK